MSVMIITGGSRGIGRAVVLGAAERGWDVAFSYVSNADAAEATAADARAKGIRCEVLQGDARDEAHLAALFDLGATLGKVDKVVVNAGVVDQQSTIADMTTDRIQRVIDINLVSAILTAREAARRLPKSKGGTGGSVVFLSSAAARLGGANNFADYAAAKGALDTLTKGLSDEISGDGVRVNAVRPGIIDTEIHADAGLPDRVAEIGHLQPMGRAGTAEETAEAILWLLSDAASYTTGTHLDVSGGR